jgi:hypothetical protein
VTKLFQGLRHYVGGERGERGEGGEGGWRIVIPMPEALAKICICTRFETLL